jgi:hypothetical protein
VEQQGKRVGELREQEDSGFWLAQQELAHDVDRRLLARRQA